MSVLFGGIAVVAFWVGAYFLVRIILAVVRGQPKGVYAKKLGAAAIIFVVALGVSSATRESPSPTKVATNETQQATDKKSAEQKGSDVDDLIKKSEALLAEEKAVNENKIQAAQEVQKPAEKPKTKEDEEFEKNYAKLNDEYKAFYEETYQSLLNQKGLFTYNEQEAREEAMTRALNKQKDADKAAAKEAKEQAENVARAKEKLKNFESSHRVAYDNLGNDTYNVSITFKHGSISTSIKDNNEYYTKDDKETMYMARECTEIVQMFNEAGVNVNHFTITMTGNVINSNGDKWEDTIGVCEFDNQKFPKNDYKSFYNKCSRFWVMESN